VSKYLPDKHVDDKRVDDKRVDDVCLQIATQNEYFKDHTGYHRQVTGKVYPKKVAVGR
jgi:hypothetical protein